MSRSIVPLALEHLPVLPRPCRSCVHWELSSVAGDASVRNGDATFDKELWMSRTLLDWGSCGRVVQVDGALAAFVTYAPPAFVPRSTGFPTSPVSADAVLLMTAAVLPEHRGAGLGRMLVQGAAKDLTRRGVRAIEAFASTGGGATAPVGRLEGSCHVPAEYLHAVGFETVRDHPRWPRLRLELRTALSWREDVERALDRILSDLRVPVLSS